MGICSTKPGEPMNQLCGSMIYEEKPAHDGLFCPFFVRWGSTKSVLGLAQCFLILRDPNSCVL